MKKTDYLVILAPMVSELGLQGNSLLVFAMIHGFSKDGSHIYRGSFQYIADWLNISLRSAKEVVDNLVRCGYINKRTTILEGGHPTNEYSTNYDSLLERVANGEVIRPEPLKRRSKAQKNNGGESAPIITTDANGGESAPLSVVKATNNGGESALNIYNIIINKDYYSSAHAREECGLQKEEEQEFYKIFFLRNAADPAAEVQRFVGYNQSCQWKSKNGTVFATPEQRRGLAYLWEFQLGAERLPKSSRTEAFLKFLGDVYQVAKVRGGIDPAKILDPRSFYREDKRFGFIWHCTGEVKDWYEGLGVLCGFLLKKHLGAGTKLFYDDYNQHGRVSNQ